MPNYEADRNTLVSIGLLSASVQNVLSKVRLRGSANEEQKRILRNAKNLTQEIRDGKLSQPSQDEYLSLPTPTAAKMRKFAIWAWEAQPAAHAQLEFDNIMKEYLDLFDDLQFSGTLKGSRENVAEEAGIFFGKLNQIVVDKLNGMTEEDEENEASSA